MREPFRPRLTFRAYLPLLVGLGAFVLYAIVVRTMGSANFPLLCVCLALFAACQVGFVVGARREIRRQRDEWLASYATTKEAKPRRAAPPSAKPRPAKPREATDRRNAAQNPGGESEKAGQRENEWRKTGKRHAAEASRRREDPESDDDRRGRDR